MPDFASLWAEMHDLYMPMDQAWWPIAGGRYERRNGIMWPFYRTEQDLDWLRSASRYVAGYHRGHAGGLIRGYCGYVIGKGMTCKPVPRDGTNDKGDMELVKAAEAELQDFSDRVLWPEMQQELFTNSLIDGDQGLWMFDMGDHLDVRTVLAENIRQPMGEDPKEWAFGRHTPADDVQRTIGWHVTDPDDYGSGDFILDSDFVYLPFMGPGGWNRTLRRGVPIFSFSTKAVFDCGAKIETNMGEGVAIRQSIPYIEQQAPGTSREDAAEDADFTADISVTNITNNQKRNIRKARAGRVPRIPEGYEFVNPPAHPETESAINAIDAMIRAGCAVLNAPHWMAGSSGRDAMAYTAELVKESPLVKTGEQIQEAYGNRFLKVCRRVLEIAVRCGRIRPETLTRLRLTMEHPSLAAQDPDKEATRDQLYVGMGVQSVQQVQQKQNIDPEKTRAEIAEFNQWKSAEAAKISTPTPAPSPNGAVPQKPGETQPLVPGIDDKDADPFGKVKE